VSLRADQPRMRGHAPTARGLVKSKGYKPSLTKPSAPTKEGSDEPGRTPQSVGTVGERKCGWIYEDDRRSR
jgi:hypothetical protein